MSTTIFRAHYDSRHFSFEAYGPTKKAARDALAKGLFNHAEITRAASDWLAEAVEEIEVVGFIVGTAYRDREAIS